MKFLWATTLTAVTLVICLSGRHARSLSKRAAFYIANETACVVDSIVYYNGDPIPTDDPCEACKCRPPGFACVLRECEVKPGCRAVRKAGHCCPDYICGCEHNGRMFRDGDEIRDSQNPCYTCHCQGSAIACAFVDCFFRVDCAPEYVPGECCPRYDHCSPLGPPLNRSFTKDFTSSSQPSTTTTVKATASVEVFTDDPFFGFADFGADGSVEGLRRKQTTKKPDSPYDHENKDSNFPSIPSELSSISTTTSTVSSTFETSTSPVESEDSTTPIFYVPEKDDAVENKEEPNKETTIVPSENPTEPSTESEKITTEEPIKVDGDIEKDQTTNPSQTTTTQQSAKLLLYADNDEHVSELLPPSSESTKENNKIILNEINDVQNSKKETTDSSSETNKNLVTTTSQIPTTPKVVYGERIKDKSTITPIPVLLLNSNIETKSPIESTEVNKEFTDITKEVSSDTAGSFDFVHNEDDKMADVKSNEQDNNKALNTTEATTTQNSELTTSKTKREGKKKNNVSNQKESTEIPSSTIYIETESDNKKETEYTTTISYETTQTTTELPQKTNEVKHDLHSETIRTTETTPELYTTQVTEVKKLSNRETTSKDSLNSKIPSTIVTETGKESTLSTSTEFSSKKIYSEHIGHEDIY